VALTTLGCKINQFESAAMAELLRGEGFVQVPFQQEADIYVINTCTVTARTDAESRKLIRRAARRNPGARIVVTGCYAQVAAADLSALPGVHLVMGNAEKRSIVEILRQQLPAGSVAVSDMAGERTASPLRLESFSEHTRAFLQVQNGCDCRCSYCIVPFARGPSRSVPEAEVVAAVERFVARGHREVVLTGIHLGAYGLDLVPPSSLARLVGLIDSQGAVGRLRLGSVEPTEFDDGLMAVLGSSATVCPHFHIPLQSGCDAVLSRMDRPYRAELFGRVVERLISLFPDAAIGADLIAGFPGESEEEFRQSLIFVASLPLAYLHVFPFSSRPGTPASTMGGHLSPTVVRERAERYRNLGEEKRQAYAGRFVGQTLKVLAQGGGEPGMMKGLSSNYLEVVFPGEPGTVGEEVMVKVRGVTPGGVWGDIS
jgi:threonylcarbamoyladenosine tRNA methylthiotransferase MtaB